MAEKTAAKSHRSVRLIRWFAFLPLSLFASQPSSLIIDYPAPGSVFPAEFPPPTFLYRDPTPGVTRWIVTISFATGSPSLRITAPGEPWRPGEIDARAAAPTNQLPSLPQNRKGTRTWKPDAAAWSLMKTRSRHRPFTVAIAGYREANSAEPVSRGTVSIQFSQDPVGAPIFYRDVSLMPSETEKGIIKPLASDALPLIAWRIRDVAKTRSRVVMAGLHTCANCHSVSRDGKTLGLDIDGPQNEKGLYALVSVRPQTVIRNEDMITWSTFRGKLGGKLRVGFMSQVSPDGRYVITMINDPGPEQSEYERRKSNSFPKVSPDGRWIVFVQARNGLLMRPDSQLYIVPLAGGMARRMRCNPPLMNSWHSFSPNGRWMVFSSKSLSPYTQMFLTHLDEQGNDTPPLLFENATACSTFWRKCTLKPVGGATPCVQPSQRSQPPNGRTISA